MNIDGNIQDKHSVDKNEKLTNNNNYNQLNETENEEENNIIINNFEQVIRKVKSEMKQYFDKNIKETLELKNEKKFQAIKKYFESEENQNENNPILNSRRENKVKTAKMKQSKLLESINENAENEENDEKIEKKKPLIL